MIFVGTNGEILKASYGLHPVMCSSPSSQSKKSREILKVEWRSILFLGQGERSLALGYVRLKGQLYIKYTMALCPSLLNSCLNHH